MDDARHAEVTRLLKRGLNHYGLGDLEAAISCWEQARALDPENQAVHDYLETAHEEQAARQKKAAPAKKAVTPPKPAARGRARRSLPRSSQPRAPVTDEDDTPKSGPR